MFAINMGEFMRKAFQVATLGLTLVCYIPSKGFSLSPEKVQIERMAHALLSRAAAGDMPGVLEPLNEFHTSLEKKASSKSFSLTYGELAPLPIGSSVRALKEDTWLERCSFL